MSDRYSSVMVGTQSFRAAKLIRNTQICVAAVGIPFMLLGAVGLIGNLALGEVGTGVGMAATLWIAALVIGTLYTHIRLSAQIVIDHDKKTVSIENYVKYTSRPNFTRPNFTFEELEKGNYRLQFKFNTVWLVGSRQDPSKGKITRERVQVDALGLMFPSNESGFYSYEDLPKPFNVPGLELEPWTEASWSDSFLRATLIRR